MLARSAFHHSVNYRSVVVMGRAEPITDLDERRAALDVLVDAIVPGRSEQPRPQRAQLRATLVLALPLAECSVKARTGGRGGRPRGHGAAGMGRDHPGDHDLWHPVPDAELDPPLDVPPSAAAYARPRPG